MTDRAYMLDAYYQMLGPKGRAVADNWYERGVVRQHTSWTVDPLSMAGEEVAQAQLDMIEAEKSAVPLDFNDSALSTVSKEREHG